MNPYNQQQGYNQYPPQGGANYGGYPPQQGGYPPQQGGYPPQQGGYPPQNMGGYNQQQNMYQPQLTRQYNFKPEDVQRLGMQIFQQFDADRSGKLSSQEGLSALNAFCQMTNQPAVNPSDFQMMFQRFDYDRSGQLDYGEFKMLIDQMGGNRNYSQQDIMNYHNNQSQRINQYSQNRGGCNLF